MAALLVPGPPARVPVPDIPDVTLPDLPDY
jgi:hypothetical protein